MAGPDEDVEVRVRTSSEVEPTLASVLDGWGAGALSEAKVVALHHPSSESPGFVASLEGASAPLAYGQLLAGNGGWGFEIALAPGTGAHAGALSEAVLDAAWTWLADRGGGHLHLWHRRTDDADVLGSLARARGLAPSRTLLELAVPLPLDPALARSARVATRPFRPGIDEDAWLTVNNRAFATHPEQGGWDRATLEAREAQPWFDPAGFLLHEEQGELVASCWTKIHREVDPPAGEIYVISVDPDAAGRGLGRALTVAGLEWIAAQGISVGMLYVEADNEAAVALYRSLGFEEVSALIAYEGDIGPGAATAGA
jgi:mycothiol synthase